MDKRSIVCVFFLLCVHFSGKSASAQTTWISDLQRGKDLEVVVYGTSLSAGSPAKAWVEGLKDSLNRRYSGKVNIRNMGQVAMHSDWGVSNLQERVLKYSPDVVFLEFAINDAYLPYNISLKASEINLRYMIDRIRAQNPNCQIIVQIMNLPVGEHLEVRPEIERYYNMYASTGRKLRVKVIDHRSYWKPVLRVPSRYKHWVPDGIHPSTEANRELVLPYIIKSLDSEAK